MFFSVPDITNQLIYCIRLGEEKGSKGLQDIEAGEGFGTLCFSLSMKSLT